jgi:hypothetical protein
MGFQVTRKTTFGRLGAMQDFMDVPSDPFSSSTRWTKLPMGVAESMGTRERRAFQPHDVVHEVLYLG